MRSRLRPVSLTASLAALSSACGALPLAPTPAPKALCRAQSLSCFDSRATVSLGSQRVETSVISEDLPEPGFANRWHYRLGPEADAMLAPLLNRRHETPICGGAVVWPGGQGGMWQHATGSWRLDMRPTDPGVAKRFALIAGVNECRTQGWTVLRIDGHLEILIEELAP